MPDNYIIYRNSGWGSVDNTRIFFFYFIGLGDPDKTVMWSADISQAKTFDSYEEALAYAIPNVRNISWGVDLHPESRYGISNCQWN